MTEEFTNYDVYSNGKMEKLNQSQVQQDRSAGRAPGATQEDSKRLVNLLHMSKMIESEADEMFKSTNCLLCWYPKSHAENHHMPVCGFLKRYGITCSYNQTTDMRISKKSRNKYTGRRKKNSGLDAEDTKIAVEADKKVQAKKDEAIKEQAASNAAGMNTVGANKKDSKSTSAANESIKKK